MIMEKNIQIGGGKKMFHDADLIIAIHKNHLNISPRIKIIRSKYTPLTKDDGRKEN